MTLLRSLSIFALAAGLALAAPAVSSARDVHYYTDRDHDGHFVKHTADVHGYRGGSYGGGRYYGGGGYYGGGRYYGRPYYGGGGYYGGYYGYPYYRSGLSFAYVGGGPAYGYGYDTGGNLAADVQRALKRRGYYGGAVDGDIGPGSRNALRNYQADHRLGVTGRIDSSTIDSLGL